jgi:hypothetical protein
MGYTPVKSIANIGCIFGTSIIELPDLVSLT